MSQPGRPKGELRSAQHDGAPGTDGERTPQAIHLSLVSHTNIGKTALARTLLGQDVGEVRDAAHVTDAADSHTLLQTPQGDELQLWDTPGFGDSTRLLKRLRQSDRPLGWLLGQAWDRWRDRPFWASQQAMRHVVERSDVMLYLVSAAEAPAAAAYVNSEMDLLEWVGKPVIVLLNQLGAPREAALEAAEIEAWRQHLAPRAFVKQVLPMDAFARCWVQESVLLRAVEACVADEPARADGAAHRTVADAAAGHLRRLGRWCSPTAWPRWPRRARMSAMSRG